MVALNVDYNEPPAHILEWCRNCVRIIADGGIWGIPRSGTIFRVDHQNKKLVLVTPGNDDDGDYNATKEVFKYIGWTVVKDE
jgi:hypothetical protein